MAKAKGIIFFDYVLEEDRGLPINEQTTWKLKTLTLPELEACSDIREERSSDGAEVTQANFLCLARKVLNFGLQGFENYPGPDGRPVEFRAMGKGRDRRIAPEVLDVIDPLHAAELAGAIFKGSKLDEATSKNS